MSTYRPTQRPRDQRIGQATRDEHADVLVEPADLVMPLFVRDGQGIDKPVSSMPGVSQMSTDVAVNTIREQVSRGLRRFILFGIVDSAKKDATGSAALDVSNPVHTTLRQVRDAGIDCEMMADLCVCEYTDHGHCGVLHDDPEVTVDNDATLELLAQQAVLLADNGADIVAPSGMMDGQVGAIRQALGSRDTKILSYAIKYASSLYGPFREAGEGAPKFGDRRSYQMDYRRSDEWATELALDLEEGADMVMVKPAAAYLDIIRQVRDAAPPPPEGIPVAAYHVSGEYSMIHAAAERGWCDLQSAALEITTAIRRAGADSIVTYFAPRLVDWID